jgi:hypothetical protein
MRRGVFLGSLIAAFTLVGTAGAATPRLSAEDRAQVNHTLDVFVNHAVKRHDPAAAYDVVTPTLKGGMTRAQWAKGDIGVYPYPAVGKRFHEWTIQYRTKDELSVELILAPTKRHRATLGQILFNVYLHPSHGRWLVDSFMPGATFAPIGKPGVVQAARDFTANPERADVQPRRQVAGATRSGPGERKVGGPAVRGHPSAAPRPRGAGRRREPALPTARGFARASA